jgi:hypothetical protein
MRAFCAMLIVWAVAGAGPRAHAAPELVNGIQAVVHDSVVTVAELQVRTFQTREVLARQYASQPEVFVKKLAEARNENLDELIDRQLILRDFQVTFSQPERMAIINREIKKEVDQEIEAEIRARYGGSRVTIRTSPRN